MPKHETNQAETVVMTVPEAGKKLRLGRNAAYAAAARGEIPTIRIGKLLKVPRAAFEAMLASAFDPNPARKQIS